MGVLILGAGGFLGLNTVDAMLAQGIELRCGRRRRSNVLGLRERKVPLVEADLELPATLHAAMAGCKTVVHLAGHYPRLSNDPQKSKQTAVRQTQVVLDAAAAAGIQRLIYVSSTATVAARAGSPSTEADVFAQAPRFGTYHDLKWEMEAQVTAERRFETVTLCPGACLGAFDWKIGTAAILWQLMRGECPPHPDGIVSWVDVRDVGDAIARLVRTATPPRRLLLVAHSLRFHQFLLGAAGRYQVSEISEPLTADEAITLADLEEARAIDQGGRPRLSREIVDLIIHGAQIDAAESRRLLGLTYRSLEQSLEAFDGWARRMGAARSSTRSEVHP